MQNSRTKSEAGLLVLVVFLLGLLVGGVGYRLWGGRVFGAPRDVHGGPPPGRGPQGQTFSEKMGLSADQQKQLDAIFTNAHPQFAALDAQRNALHEQVRQQIRAILTSDQQVKFDAMVKDEEAHGRGPSRGPGPGGPPRLGPPPNGSPNQGTSQQAPAQH